MNQNCVQIVGSFFPLSKGLLECSLNCLDLGSKLLLLVLSCLFVPLDHFESGFDLRILDVSLALVQFFRAQVAKALTIDCDLSLQPLVHKVLRNEIRRLRNYRFTLVELLNDILALVLRVGFFELLEGVLERLHFQTVLVRGLLVLVQEQVQVDLFVEVESRVVLHKFLGLHVVVHAVQLEKEHVWRSANPRF